MDRAVLNWLRASWDAVRTSLWLTPTVMFLLGLALAAIMLRLDAAVGPLPQGLGEWLRSGSGDDARNLLSTLLTSVIAMAGIVFSVTVVSLSLAANAYGPRLIRTFRANRGTQLALGAFMMTIVYLLVVLRAVRGDAPSGEVQELAVGVGSILALACVVALLGFIQGVSSLIVADEVVRRVRRELDSAIDDLPSHDHDPACANEGLPIDFPARAARIALPREGYVQSVAFDQIVSWAKTHGSIVRLDFRPGDFVVDGDHKVLVDPPPDDLELARREIDRFIVTGGQRTPTQDIEFAVRHLVEVAVRALSPGINDPFTAMAVVDRLRGGLARLAGRRLPSAFLYDEDGALRVVRHVTDFGGVMSAALDQIRQAGAPMPSVMIHMLRALGALAEHLRSEEQHCALAHHARLIRDAAVREACETSDLEDIDREYGRVRSALAQSRGQLP